MQVDGGDGERMEKAHVPSTVADAQLLAPCHVAGPQRLDAFLAVSRRPPSPAGAREAAPCPSAAQGALAAAR